MTNFYGNNRWCFRDDQNKKDSHGEANGIEVVQRCNSVVTIVEICACEFNGRLQVNSKDRRK